jgi:hypothetical protein
MTQRFALALMTLAAVSAGPSQAFGPKGHQTVGAIADQRLANRPVASKIHDLLDGLTLEEAAVLPDEIKSWDSKPPSDPRAFHLKDHPVIEADLVKFWKAHSDKAARDYHRNFHFADVPVGGNSKYADGTTGRSEFDLVHLINVCIKVLQTGEEQLAITPRVAVILLAHYVGDIAQPLHVGSQYFDSDGRPSNPDKDKGKLELGDVGGNNLMLILRSESERGRSHSSVNLHSYWDDETVDTAYQIVLGEIASGRSAPSGSITDAMIKRRLALKEPAGWKLPADVTIDKYAEKWADDVLPLANEAHARLDFKNVVAHGKSVRGFAEEKDPQPDGKSYADWSGMVVRNGLHKAGWRLADILEKAIP